jgi:hypothetical protein
MIYVWALATLRDGSAQFVVLSREDVMRHKARSAAVRAGQPSPWDTDEAWMWRKTALKQLVKLLPLSVRAARAVGLDDRAEAGLAQDLAVLVDPQTSLTPEQDVEPPVARPQAVEAQPAPPAGPPAQEPVPTAPPPEAPAAPAPLLVEEVREVSRQGRTWWVARFSDGRTAATLDQALATALQQARAERRPVRQAVTEAHPGKLDKLIEVVLG